MRTFTRQEWFPTKVALNDLPEAARPKLRDLPEDAEIYVWGPWGFEPACPMLVVGFSEGKVVKFELLTPKKESVPKPAVPTVKKRQKKH